MEQVLVVRVDGKGRLVIPKQLRERLGIKDAVRLRVEGDRLVIEPVRDPLERLTAAVLEGTRDVEAELRMLREEALAEARRVVAERWQS